MSKAKQEFAKHNTHNYTHNHFMAII